MPVVIVQKWEESERGWGTRPDGYSIHKSAEDLRKYIADEWAAEKKRNPSGAVPDEYSRTCGTPYEAEVDAEVYASIGDRRGLRVFNDNTLAAAGEMVGFRCFDSQRPQRLTH